MTVCKRSRGTAPLIINLGARWMRVVNTTFRPLYPRERNSVLTKQEDGRAPETVWTFWRKEKSPLPEFEPPNRPVCSLVTTPAELSRLHRFKYILTAVISVPNEDTRNADVRSNGGTAPLILNLGTTWSQTSSQLHDQVTLLPGKTALSAH